MLICGSCQQVRKPSVVALLTPWLWPSNPWFRVHVDYAYDNYSHFTGTIRQIWIASALYNGPQFRSEEFAHFMKFNGVKHIRVAPYNVASNGMGERMVQSFKNHMKACKSSKLSIQQHTTNYLLTYRSTRHPTTGRTPAGLFLG